MDSTFAQIAVPLAAAAASAYSPYVQRGLGPGLAALGAMGAFQNQKARNDLMQQDLSERQQAMSDRAALADALTTATNQGQPIPQGRSFASAIGAEPQVGPDMPAATSEIPAGAIAATPSQAAMIRGTAKYDPRLALSYAESVNTQNRRPTTQEAIGTASKVPYGARVSIPTRTGETVSGGEAPPMSAEDAYVADAKTPEEKQAREKEILGKRYPGRLTPKEIEANAAAAERGRMGVTGWEPTPGQMTDADRRAKVAARVDPTPENGLDRPTIDQDIYNSTYDAVIEKYRPAWAKGAPQSSASAPGGYSYMTKDGKFGWNGQRWVPTKTKK